MECLLKIKQANLGLLGACVVHQRITEVHRMVESRHKDL